MPEKPPISVLFHRPGSPALERLIPSEHGETCFRMHPWVRADQHKPIEIRGRIEIGASVFGDQRPIIKPNAHALRGSERHAHMDLVALGKAHIASGKMEKVVLSSQLTVGIATLDPEEVVRRQAQAHPDSFSWMVQHPDIGMWFGSSPEPLIEGEWPRFRTACLAGTRMSHTGAQSDPWTTKEIQEQQFVVDAVLASLQKSECEAVDIGQRETVQYGPIEHLRTIVNFSATRPASDVVAALHPTPAVGGTPREAALDFIQDHEDHDRAYYTGWVGLEQGKDVRYFVNLRCAALHNGELTAYAGGGITAGSDPASEWQETRNKLRAVLDPIVHWSK